MGLLTNEYPQEVWVNILTLDGKVIDYKIGGSKRDKGSWTIRYTKELMGRYEDMKVESTSIMVSNSEEQNEAFVKGRRMVKEQVEKYGSYYNFRGLEEEESKSLYSEGHNK